MIKEFWQERKDEKKRQKELKKQNKKLPKTREQRAYKVFGVCLTLFLIFSSVFNTCRGSGNLSDYSWNNMIGITDEMKTKLESPVDLDKLIINKQISTDDWANCKKALIGAGLNVIVSDEISQTILAEKSETLESNLILDSAWFGAFVDKLVESDTLADSINVIEVNLSEENSQLRITSLMVVDLNTVVISDNLPSVYVTTISTINILNNQMYCMNSELQINDFSEVDNEEILAVIDRSSVVDIEFYTNEFISRLINSFCESVNASIAINNNQLELVAKN